MDALHFSALSRSVPHSVKGRGWAGVKEVLDRPCSQLSLIDALRIRSDFFWRDRVVGSRDRCILRFDPHRLLFFIFLSYPLHNKNNKNGMSYSAHRPRTRVTSLTPCLSFFVPALPLLTYLTFRTFLLPPCPIFLQTVHLQSRRHLPRRLRPKGNRARRARDARTHGYP